MASKKNDPLEIDLLESPHDETKNERVTSDQPSFGEDQLSQFGCLQPVERTVVQDADRFVPLQELRALDDRCCGSGLGVCNPSRDVG